MPHIIVEYSKTLDQKIPALLYDLHDALAAQGVDKARIKTRGIMLDHAVVSEDGAAGQMIHVTLLILAGRDAVLKKQFGDALYDVVKRLGSARCAVTLEIRDMDPDMYYL